MYNIANYKHSDHFPLVKWTCDPEIESVFAPEETFYYNIVGEYDDKYELMLKCEFTTDLNNPMVLYMPSSLLRHVFEFDEYGSLLVSKNAVDIIFHPVTEPEVIDLLKKHTHVCTRCLSLHGVCSCSKYHWKMIRDYIKLKNLVLYWETMIHIPTEKNMERLYNEMIEDVCSC